MSWQSTVALTLAECYRSVLSVIDSATQVKLAFMLRDLRGASAAACRALQSEHILLETAYDAILTAAQDAQEHCAGNDITSEEFWKYSDAFDPSMKPPVDE